MPAWKIELIPEAHADFKELDGSVKKQVLKQLIKIIAIDKREDLKELPFVEIEESKADKSIKPVRRGKESLETLFGLWENREISLIDIRNKAWNRDNDTL